MNVKQLKELLENYSDDTKVEVLYGTSLGYMFEVDAPLTYRRIELDDEYVQYNEGENTLFLGYDE